ncbi:MAG: hypothetical protein ACYDGM_07545 [Vulcanimicrobiaceae bacterium]
MENVIFYFGNNADTMIATKALKDVGILAKMIPKPSVVSSGANICLSLHSSVELQATTALTGAGVALGGILK